jgi:myo-inositol 2-dehydrogenase/D-chiro-inositol 1-dehydrogenase
MADLRGFPDQRARRSDHMTNPLGVGFIGAGPVVQTIHLPAIAGLSDRLRVARVMDVDLDTVKAVAARAPGAEHGTSVEELLADPAVEIVAIGSPHQFHAEQAIAACAAGKRAILVEKPLAVSLDDARRLAEAARTASVPVVVGAMHSYDQAWLDLSQRWGDLPGDARHVRSVIQLPPNARYEDLSTQLHSRPQSAAPVSGPDIDRSDPAVQQAMLSGAVLGLTIHNLPHVRRFLPEIAAVDHVRLLEPFGYVIRLRGPDGRTAELIGYITSGWRPEWTFEVWGASGELSVDFPPSFVRAGSATAALRTAEGEHRFGPYPDNGYISEWHELVRVADGGEPRYSLDDLVADLAYALEIAERAAEVL